MREAKKKKTLDRDCFFTRSMIDVHQGSVLIRLCGGSHRSQRSQNNRSPITQRHQRALAKQIKFLRNLGLQSTTHTQMVFTLGSTH